MTFTLKRHQLVQPGSLRLLGVLALLLRVGHPFLAARQLAARLVGTDESTRAGWTGGSEPERSTEVALIGPAGGAPEEWVLKVVQEMVQIPVWPGGCVD